MHDSRARDGGEVAVGASMATINAYTVHELAFCINKCE